MKRDLLPGWGRTRRCSRTSALSEATTKLLILFRSVCSVTRRVGLRLHNCYGIRFCDICLVQVITRRMFLSAAAARPALKGGLVRQYSPKNNRRSWRYQNKNGTRSSAGKWKKEKEKENKKTKQNHSSRKRSPPHKAAEACVYFLVLNNHSYL